MDETFLSIVVYDVLRCGALHLFVHWIHLLLCTSLCLVAHFHTIHHPTCLLGNTLELMAKGSLLAHHPILGGIINLTLVWDMRAHIHNIILSLTLTKSPLTIAMHHLHPTKLHHMNTPQVQFSPYDAYHIPHNST